MSDEPSVGGLLAMLALLSVTVVMMLLNIGSLIADK